MRRTLSMVAAAGGLVVAGCQTMETRGGAAAPPPLDPQVARVAGLQAEVRSLSEQVAILTGDVARLQDENARLRAAVEEVRARPSDAVTPAQLSATAQALRQEIAEANRQSLAATGRSIDLLAKQTQSGMDALAKSINERAQRIASTPPAIAPGTEGIVYTVQAGDTLSTIARRFGVTVATLQSVNQIANPSTIRVGQNLFIPQPGGGGAAGRN